MDPRVDQHENGVAKADGTEEEGLPLGALALRIHPLTDAEDEDIYPFFVRPLTPEEREATLHLFDAPGPWISVGRLMELLEWIVLHASALALATAPLLWFFVGWKSAAVALIAAAGIALAYLLLTPPASPYAECRCGCFE